MTVDQAQRRIAAARRKFGVEAGAVARKIATRIGARATSMPFMRRDVIRPRDPMDQGPLRRQTEALFRAVRGGSSTFSPGTVERLAITGFRARLEKGVDSRVVPYALRHEMNPRFSYIRPATLIERRTIARQEGNYLRSIVLTELRNG